MSPAGTALLRAAVHSLPSVRIDTSEGGEGSHVHPQGWMGHEAEVEGVTENCSEIKTSSVCYEPDLLNYPQILFFIQKLAPS